MAWILCLLDTAVHVRVAFLSQYDHHSYVYHVQLQHNSAVTSSASSRISVGTRAHGTARSKGALDLRTRQRH